MFLTNYETNHVGPTMKWTNYEMQVGPCIPLGTQLQKEVAEPQREPQKEVAEVGPTSGPTRWPSRSYSMLLSFWSRLAYLFCVENRRLNQGDTAVLHFRTVAEQPMNSVEWRCRKWKCYKGCCQNGFKFHGRSVLAWCRDVVSLRAQPGELHLAVNESGILKVLIFIWACSITAMSVYIFEHI